MKESIHLGDLMRVGVADRHLSNVRTLTGESTFSTIAEPNLTHLAQAFHYHTQVDALARNVLRDRRHIWYDYLCRLNDMDSPTHAWWRRFGIHIGLITPPPDPMTKRKLFCFFEALQKEVDEIDLEEALGELRLIYFVRAHDRLILYRHRKTVNMLEKAFEDAAISGVHTAAFPFTEKDFEVLFLIKRYSDTTGKWLQTYMPDVMRTLERTLSLNP